MPFGDLDGAATAAIPVAAGAPLPDRQLRPALGVLAQGRSAHQWPAVVGSLPSSSAFFRRRRRLVRRRRRFLRRRRRLWSSSPASLSSSSASRRRRRRRFVVVGFSSSSSGPVGRFGSCSSSWRLVAACWCRPLPSSVFAVAGLAAVFGRRARLRSRLVRPDSAVRLAVVRRWIMHRIVMSGGWGRHEPWRRWHHRPTARKPRGRPAAAMRTREPTSAPPFTRIAIRKIDDRAILAQTRSSICWRSEAAPSAGQARHR